MAKTLDDARDFIGNARNVLAAQHLNNLVIIDTLKHHNVGDLTNEISSISDDPDFPSPKPVSLLERLDKTEALNAEMFDLLGQLQSFFDNYPKDLKDAIASVGKMGVSAPVQTRS